MPPFVSEMSLYPGKDIGIFTATNQMPGSSTLNHPQLHREIFDILRDGGISKSTVESEKINFMPETVVETKNLTEPMPLNVEQLTQYVGSYGNGLQGEIEISLRNITQLYMDYGTWGQAFLLGTNSLLTFELNWDSDVVQDKFAFELSENETFVIFSDDLTELRIVDNGVSSETFKRGVNLENLPVIPWSPGSC